MKLTQEYIRQIFDYNYETGILYWKYNAEKPIEWNSRYVYNRAALEYFGEFAECFA